MPTSQNDLRHPGIENVVTRRAELIDWILDEGSPAARYLVASDLTDADARDVSELRAHMVADPAVQQVMMNAAGWGDRALKRHNDASHPLTALSVLADFGLSKSDPGIEALWTRISAHISEEGLFETLVNVPKPFGGSGLDEWAWMACDASALLYPILAFGYGDDARVIAAVDRLMSLAAENGWPCAATRRFGKFKGPGKREDPCPITTVHALKALSLLPNERRDSAVQSGVNMVLGHWADRGTTRFYMFGIGTDFQKIKYPTIWYDILHVTEVLSRFPCAVEDPRFADMLAALCQWADDEGRFTARSMYRAWKGWDFADKKQPSPWLTALVLRMLSRVRAGSQ